MCPASVASIHTLVFTGEKTILKQLSEKKTQDRDDKDLRMSGGGDECQYCMYLLAMPRGTGFEEISSTPPNQRCLSLRQAHEQSVAESFIMSSSKTLIHYKPILETLVYDVLN